MANFSFVTDLNFTSNTQLVSAGYSYDFDDLPTDGITNTFTLTYNTDRITVSNPKQILVSINGALQPSFDYNYNFVWGLGMIPVFGAMIGYTITQDGNLTFAQAPARGAQTVIQPVLGNLQPVPKTYPFRALDILMGP